MEELCIRYGVKLIQVKSQFTSVIGAVLHTRCMTRGETLFLAE